MKNRKKSFLLLILCIISGVILCACSDSDSSEATATPAESSSLTYIGHSSIKIKTKDNKVIYVDPAATGDYKEAADIILVTHNHTDHNNVSLVTTKDNTKTITTAEALKDGVHQTLDIEGIKIQAVPAYNKNHDKASTVGYVIEFDGIKIYHAGDTSTTDEMKTLSSQGITYALFPIDGVYNMGAGEAKEAAKIVNAKHSIPMHTSELNKPFNEVNANAFSIEPSFVLKYKDTIHLEA